MKPKQLITLGITFAAALLNCSADLSTNFFDGTFDLSQWTTTRIDGFGGTVSTAQVATGGNPGFYLRVNHNNFDDYMVDISLRSDAVYSPSNIPNALIDYSIDEAAIEILNGIGIAAAVALRQNGTNYFGPAFINSYPVWQTFSGGNLSASDFTTYVHEVIAGPNHPDFSAGGSPIQFGLLTLNNNGGIFGSRAAGFDNWSVIVHQAPTITNPIVLGSGQLQMQLLTTVGHSDTLQASADLVQWVTILTTNNVRTNVVVLLDPNSVTNFAQRFFRVMDSVP